MMTWAAIMTRVPVTNFKGLSKRNAPFSKIRFLVQCAVGVLAVDLLTQLGLLVHINLSTSGLLYLLTVVLVALSCGFWQASVVSGAALLCQWYYFVPPAHTWRVTDPGNYVEMFVFACTALVVSRLSSKAEQHARQAERQRAEMEMLYDLTRKTLLFDLHQSPAAKLVEVIVRTFCIDAIAIFDASRGSIDSWGVWQRDPRELTESTYQLGMDQDDQSLRVFRRVLRLGSVPIGAMLLRGDVAPLTMDAIASLASITFDRYRSFSNETRAEAAHQSEQLRTTVLDRLGHAFKTPVTAIRTASAGLIELGELSPLHADLAGLIEEQAILLNDLATRLLQTAKLESEEISLHKENITIVELIEVVVNEQDSLLAGHDLKVSISDRTLATRGDRELLATILRQFVDNAAKYSYAGTPIEITAEEVGSEIVIGVHNEGRPIPLQDRERIFERFYRSSEAQQLAPGTGIGLSVAKKAAEAHHGHVWVISDKDAGTTFYFSVRGSAVRGSREGVVDRNDT
jgi:two-component system, OmpR family, sensor histidine kinase KdpD